MDNQQRHAQLVNEYETLYTMALDRGIPYHPVFEDPNSVDDAVLVHEVSSLRWLLRTPQG